MSLDSDSSQMSTFHLRRRSPGSFLLVPCPRMGRAIRCQGQLQAATAMILANCPSVTSVQEQPFQIWYAWRDTPTGPQIQLLSDRPIRKLPNGTRSSYVVPDFLVRMEQKSVRLVEVQTSHQLGRQIVQRKLAVARAYARQVGWEYHVVTEQQLLSGSLLANARLLSRYRQSAVDEELVDQLIAFVTDNRVSAVSLKDFHRTTSEFEEQQLRLACFHLLAAGRLDCDPVTAPIGDTTTLYPGGTHPWDPFDSAWGRSGCGKDDRSASSGNSPPDGSSSGT